MSEQYLKDAIVEYIKNNSNVNSDGIVSHFQLRVDITYTAIKELEKENLIVRHNGSLGGWNGNHHYAIR